MPSGPPELHEEFGSDRLAYLVLRMCGWRCSNGMWRMPPGRTREYPVETRALDYLWLEWDEDSDATPRLLLR